MVVQNKIINNNKYIKWICGDNNGDNGAALNNGEFLWAIRTKNFSERLKDEVNSLEAIKNNVLQSKRVKVLLKIFG